VPFTRVPAAAPLVRAAVSPFTWWYRTPS